MNTQRMVDLREVWREIRSKEKCGDCPLLENGEPLIIKPKELNKIKVMVITEGPNRRIAKGPITREVMFLTSIANHPTFTFLFSLFGGKFRPTEASANAYWTHVRKCFIDGNMKNERKALKQCKVYLGDEIEALKPKLIVAIGNEALESLYSLSGDCRLKGKLTEVFLKQGKGIFSSVRIGGAQPDVAVVPHPSRQNRFWNKPPPKTREILEKVRERFVMETLEDE